MCTGNYPFWIELQKRYKTEQMHWSLTQKCALLHLALVGLPNELQNTCSLIYWKPKTLRFVGRACKKLYPPKLAQKMAANRVNFRVRFQVHCWTVLAIPGHTLDFLSFLGVPSTLSNVCMIITGMVPIILPACLEFVLNLEVSSLVLKWGLSRRLLGGVFCGSRG